MAQDAFLEYLDSLEEDLPSQEENSSFLQQNQKIEGCSSKKAENKGVIRLKLKDRRDKHRKNKNPILESKYEPSGEFIHKNKEIATKNEEKKETEDALVQKLLLASETYYENEWLEKYESAHKSKKNNYIVEKMRKGKFRLNEKHQIEILSDFDLHGKTSDEILSRNYD